MKKSKSLLVLGGALLLLGFFLPYVSYGSRSVSGWDIIRRLIGQGYLRDTGQLVGVIGLLLQAAGAVVALFLALMGKRGQSAVAAAAGAGLALFLLVDLSGVFRAPGIGLFVALGGLVVLVYRALMVRRG